MKKSIEIADDEGMQRLGHAIASLSIVNLNLFLCGPLGVGKTTFTRGFLRASGYKGKVKSPTYALVETYEIAERTIHHFDFYRVKHTDELTLIGIHDYFAPPVVSLIEWPEQVASVLPAPDLSCYIEFQGSGRSVHLIAHSQEGQRILTQLNA